MLDVAYANFFSDHKVTAYVSGMNMPSQ